MTRVDVNEVLKSVQLHYCSETDLSIHRKKVGRGFRYIYTSGQPVEDDHILDQVTHLAIPPAWHDVAISKSPCSHIQAIGYDDKGRKQYLYHTEWNTIQQQSKFNKMIFLGEVLPELRAKVRVDMQIKGLKRERVISTVVWLLEKTFIRVGNKEYAKEHAHFGLTTLRNKHVDIVGDQVKFEFKGKSGVYHAVEVEHPRIAKTIRKCIELPGYELFQYIDEEGKRQVVDSKDVNEYLRSITGEDFTAKDFRTWGGTVLAGTALHHIGPFASKTIAKKNITKAIKEVSKHLGNTPTTCRCYYVHPTVIDSYNKEILIPHFDDVYKRRRLESKLHVDEYATWSLLREQS
jgi:DNA topoisomerase I